MFERIKRFYKLGLWIEKMVKEALDKNIITEDQYKEICGIE